MFLLLIKYYENGDSKINSSIGAQWRSRIDAVDEQIMEMTELMTEEELEETLNVKLKY